MSNAAQTDRAALDRIRHALRMVTVPFPHLSGLAAAVRIALDHRVPTMGVFASGRLVANPAFAGRLSGNDLIFVLAHELLHLALRTHDRARGAHHLEFNYAHDYIINDMLRHALGVSSIPAGGLDMPGAREKSAEEIIVQMRNSGSRMPSRTRVWEGEIVAIDRALGATRQGAPEAAGDVLDAALEREMYPDDAEDQDARTRAVRDLAARGMALAKAMGAIRGRGTDPGSLRRNVRALRGIYQAPWQMALQTWLEGVSPGERTFVRPSRRGADRIDIVSPGRKRYTWMLNIVLDTSASMTDNIPVALGAIADFCEVAGVDDIRVVQCDTVVTSDRMLSPAELAEYEIGGYGGSNLSPALQMLADDPRVNAAVVITDGDIEYPGEAPPYAVLWALPRESASFRPPYGRVIVMRKEDSP